MTLTAFVGIILDEEVQERAGEAVVFTPGVCLGLWGKNRVGVINDSSIEVYSPDYVI